MYVNALNGPAHDTHGGDVCRRFVVASTPRSASTLLCRWLWAMGGLGAPAEVLNPDAIRDWGLRATKSALGRRAWGLCQGPLTPLATLRLHRVGAIEAHLAQVQAARTDPSGWFGLKLHAHHAQRWLESKPLGVWFPQARWIHLVREDREAQAWSLARARASGRWAAHQKTSRFARPVTLRAVACAREDLAQGERYWAEKLAPFEVFTLSFEQLTTAPEATFREVLAFLSVEGAQHIPLVPMPTEPMPAVARSF